LIDTFVSFSIVKAAQVFAGMRLIVFESFEWNYHNVRCSVNNLKKVSNIVDE
jgi:hypothetical protein